MAYTFQHYGSARLYQESHQKGIHEKLFTRISNSFSSKLLPSSVLVIFIDMNTYILTERRNFKTFWKENYAVGLDSCYVFNLEHRTEHDIDSAYGVCMHYTVPNFTADEFDSLLACNIIRFLFNCLREANFLLSLGGSSQNTGKH